MDMVTSKSKTKKKRKTKTKPSVVETTFQDLKEVQKIKISDLKVKNKLYSFLASIIFIPIALFGQFFGGIIGMGLAWFNSLFTGFTMPQIFSFITTGFVAGAFAGWLAAKAVLKMNKHINYRYTVALPIIIMAIAILGDVSLFLKYGKFNDFILRFVREVATISLFMMTIKDDTQIA
tara:strand:+ start:500 stop:1030 length:531 start_codon:yes stop_codon:yes gene_type:complete